MHERGGMSRGSRGSVTLLLLPADPPSARMPLIPANAACVEATKHVLRLTRIREAEQRIVHVFTRQVATPSCLQTHQLGSTIVVSCHSLAQLSRSHPVWDREASRTFSALGRARLRWPSSNRCLHSNHSCWIGLNLSGCVDAPNLRLPSSLCSEDSRHKRAAATTARCTATARGDGLRHHRRGRGEQGHQQPQKRGTSSERTRPTVCRAFPLVTCLAPSPRVATRPRFS